MIERRHDMSEEDIENIIYKILREEAERRRLKSQLIQELHEIEAQGDMRDVKRMTEIIDELNIIDPPEEDEVDYLKRTEKMPQIRVRRKKKILSILFRVSAIFIVVLFCIQAVPTASSSNRNFFDNVVHWTRSMIMTFVGSNEQKDDKKIEASEIKRYKDIKEFKKAEKIDILIPNYIPNSAKIESINYIYDEKNEKIIDIRYDDNVTLLKIIFNEKIDSNATNDATILQCNDNQFYVSKNIDTIISWEYDNNYYILICKVDVSDYGEILKIVKNIKSIK